MKKFLGILFKLLWFAWVLWAGATPRAQAGSGTWVHAASGGLWSSPSNWSNLAVADGSGATADFSTINIKSNNTVHLDSPRTLTALMFGDTTTSSAAGWVLDNNGSVENTLTLAGTGPTVTVNALGTGQTASISAGLAGTAGLVKDGMGTLVLSGANTYTGTTTLSGGVLEVGLLGSGTLGTGGLVFANGAVLQGSGTFTNNFSGSASAGSGKLSGLSGGFAARGGPLTINFGGANAKVVLSSGSYRFGGGFVFGSPTADNKVTVSNPMSLGVNYANRTFTVNSGLGGDWAELAGVIDNSGASVGGLIKDGSGLLVLSRINAYDGPTIINGGTLALSGSGSIAKSPSISVGNGATFDVSGLSSTFALGASQTLGNVSGSTGNLKGNVNAGVGTVLLFYAGGPPTLRIGSGTLSLSSNTVFNLFNPGSPLKAGSYKLISTNVGGLVAGSLPLVTLDGGGVVSGSSWWLSLSNSEVYLVVQNSTNLVLTASANPSGYQQGVVFTATLPADAGGNVVFSTFNNPFSTNAVLGGTATRASVATLPGGTNFVTATYSGDSKYPRSMATLVQRVTNAPTIYATWCMIWCQKGTNWDDATDFLGSYDAIDWSDNRYVETSLDSVKADGVDAVVCDLTNGWGWLNSLVQTIQRMAAAKSMKVCVAENSSGDVATFESHCGDIWNSFAGPSAPYRSTYLMKDGKPVLVCYSVKSWFDAYVASTGPNRQRFTLVDSSWGTQLDPAVGPVASADAVYVTPSIKYAPSSVSISLWRKSQAWLDYAFKVAKDSRPEFTIVGCFDDIHERNCWMQADTAGCIPGMQMRDMTGAISATNYYSRVREWILGTPTVVPGGLISDGCYQVLNASSGRCLNMPNSVGTNMGCAGLKLVQTAPSANLNNYFSFYHLGSNVYRVISLNSGLFLNVTNTAEGLQIQQDWNSIDFSQRWSLLPAPNGNFYLQNLASGKVLDVPSSAEGAPVVQNTLLNGVSSQQWSLSLVAGLGPSKPAPPVPAGLTATSGYAQVSLVWQASTGAEIYAVKRSATSGGPYFPLATTSATTYTDRTAVGGTPCYYVVSALASGSESDNSAEVSAIPLTPATQTNLPVADAYVRDGTYTNSNFGTETNLAVKLGGANFDREAFLRFNVSGLTNAQRVQLQLVPLSADPATTLAIEVVEDDTWSETGVTWNTKPAGSGLILTNVSGCTVGQAVTVDLTAQATLEAAGDGWLSLRIVATSTGQYSGVTFASRENGVPANRPVLSYVLSSPAPVTSPALMIQPKSGGIELSWPPAYTNYILQKLPGAFNLASNTGWIDVMGVLSNRCSDPATNSGSFFRLKSQ